jgi:hypothetical protein
MNAPSALLPDIACPPSLPAEIAAADAVFAERCEASALRHLSGELSLHDAIDELQSYAEDSGLLDRIGQDEAQRIMGETFAAADILPEADDELNEACEAEIMLAAADLVRRWESAYKPRPEPPRRAEPFRPAESTVQAFWYVARNHDADYLAAWLAKHPDDRPHLFRIWKAKRCST